MAVESAETFNSGTLPDIVRLAVQLHIQRLPRCQINNHLQAGAVLPDCKICQIALSNKDCIHLWII